MLPVGKSGIQKNNGPSQVSLRDDARSPDEAHFTRFLLNVMRYYKFRSLNNLPWIADILVENRLYCSLAENLNDPMEGLFHANLKDEGFSTLELSDCTARICAFSSVVDDILLWSHYADDHKGIAIGFVPEKEIEKVHYSDSLYTLGIHKDMRERTVGARSCYLTKLEQWEYEQEFRYISFNQDEEFIYGKVTNVIFGIRTPSPVKKFINSFCEKMEIHTEDASLDTMNYKIKTESQQIK